MDKLALIIFVRSPEWGKVKTRLARTIGNDKALVVYKELLKHTHAITRDLDCDKFIFYADAIGDNDIWNNDHYRKMLQEGDNLGSRMHHAFETVFKLGNTKIIIIGSDCYQLRPQHITDAFGGLDKDPVVIGPAIDGGYYLLGLQAMIPEIFRNISWSTADVTTQTLTILKTLHLPCFFLPVLQDVDEEADLDLVLRKLAGVTEKN